MQKYSGRMEKRFKMRVVQIAMGVETMAIDEIVRGPRSLQRRSSRRIWELRAGMLLVTLTAQRF
jgi:hypothetical protein